LTILAHARDLPAIVLATGFAVIARLMGAVSDGGAVAGAVIAFILLRAAGWAGFAPLLTVFLLTVFSTRWGYARKQQLGVAERRRGRRASQIVANLGPAAMCVLPTMLFPEVGELLLVGAVAALAEAAADTVSSEVGEATARSAYLITNFREAPIGTNGAISVEGTISGCIAASIVSWVAAGVGLIEWRWTFVVSFAAVAGMFLDSVLGATWERAGRVGNDAVNFTSNIFAADAALIAALVMQRLG
jgi:uncharacterized protein (TIGR00297 family)